MNTTRNRRVWVAAIVAGAIMSALIFGILLLPFIRWQLKPFTDLDVWVVDKTVPYPNYREHSGLFWVLNYEKLTKPGKRKLYELDRDYYGFYLTGNKNWKTRSMPVSSARPDMIYLADTYGVYTEDYMQRKLSGNFSKKMYGGLTSADTLSLRTHLGEGNTLIAEFNTAASPTNDFDRKSLGMLLNMSWRGWIGRLYEDLTRENEVPDWVIRNYEAQNKKPWQYFGRGFVLIRDDDLIEVFPTGKEVGPELLKIVYRDAWAKKFGIPDPVSYKFWFEWTLPDVSVEVVADYDWDLTEAGKEHLKKLGLPSRFPAVLHTVNPQYSGWYFAGDFADLEFKRTPFAAVGVDRLNRALVDNSVDSNDYFFWKAYVPMLRSIIDTAKQRRAEWRASAGREEDPIRFRVRAKGKTFQTRQHDGTWKDMFIRGVNLGMAMPGTFHTEYLDDLATLERWIEGIGSMNANVIRIYTLPSPVFYQALDNYNRLHPDKPIYLLQGIWPEDRAPDDNCLSPSYRESYLREIEYAVDAIYGRANITERKDRAWGVYTADVSRWLLGWLMGRELEAREVAATDYLNPGTVYKGAYISAGPGASPTEAWIAESMDEVVRKEMDAYGKMHPVGVLSWPTLDPLEHDLEWDPDTGKAGRVNDNASIDINHIETLPSMAAGIFGAYNIYPNYPDFLNDEREYGAYRDSRGRFLYGGYLRQFIRGHQKYPALVAEIGLAGGSSIAHFNPDGYHHGASPEKDQGEAILRMFEAIKAEGYMGGLVFEWMDEWVKKTWITEPFMIPYERHILWHNVDDPEQNFGLLAMESVPPREALWTAIDASGAIRQMDMAEDPAYFYLDLTFDRMPDFGKQTIYIGIDTYRRDLGQMRYPVGGLPLLSGSEFLITIFSQDRAELGVIAPYNKFLGRYDSKPLTDGAFERVIPVVNAQVSTRDGRNIPARAFDQSALNRGDWNRQTNLWKVEGMKFRFRIPWQRLNFTDPSSLRVLNDIRTGIFAPVQDQLKTEKTDGIVASALWWDNIEERVVGRLDGDPENPFSWKGWELPPPYIERYKESYYIIKQSWSEISRTETGRDP